MKLYEYWRSSAAHRVRIALNLKGIAYEPVSVDMMVGEHKQAEYAALNPQSLVPTLVDGDVVVNQSLAIIEYLDETGHQPILVPGDAEMRARIRAFAIGFAAEIHPLHNVRVLTHLGDTFGADEEKKFAWARHWVALTLAGQEARLAASAATGDFCFGDAPTLGDICLVAQMPPAKRFSVDMAPYPTLARIVETCLTLPAFEKAQPANQPGAPQK